MRPEEYGSKIIQAANAPHQFSYENGIEVVDVEQDYAKGELTVGPNSINPMGNVHGGALCTLADVVAGSCACSRGGTCVTTGSTMEFLRPANGTKITCVATPKRMGKTVSVIQVELINDQNMTVATGTFTFYMFGA